MTQIGRVVNNHDNEAIDVSELDHSTNQMQSKAVFFNAAKYIGMGT